MDLWDLSQNAEPMSLDDFWDRVERARSMAQEESRPPHETLALALSLDEIESIASFKNRFDELSAEANRDDVHRVLGGSDDGFHYNISGAISQGREAYEALMAAPGSFKNHVGEYEIFEYAAYRAAEEPERGALRAEALARLESATLEKSLPSPALSKASPRM